MEWVSMCEDLPATFCDTAEWSDYRAECHVDALATKFGALS